MAFSSSNPNEALKHSVTDSYPENVPAAVLVNNKNDDEKRDNLKSSDLQLGNSGNGKISAGLAGVKKSFENDEIFPACERLQGPVDGIFNQKKVEVSEDEEELPFKSIKVEYGSGDNPFRAISKVEELSQSTAEKENDFCHAIGGGSGSSALSQEGCLFIATGGGDDLFAALDKDAEACGCLDDSKVYYNKHRKEFLVKSQLGEWMHLTESQCRRELKARGFSAIIPKGENLSSVDKEMRRIMHRENIAYSGPIAGLKEGFYDLGQRVIVTESPRLIVPKSGDWSTLKAFLDGLLSDEKYPQQTYLFGWLKITLESLYDCKHSFGQAVVLAGPAGCGKSFLQNLITVLFGGRSAKPYQYMTDRTAFNADLFGAEHLMIEDETPDVSFRARKKFGTELKQIVVNRTQRLHAKGRDAIMLKPFWRLTISLNDEPEDMHVLPPIDDSIKDKLILLRAYQRLFPMPTETQEEQAKFESQLLSEMPAFIHWLLHNFRIPKNLGSKRFGIAHFHHPELIRKMEELAPQRRLLEMIDKHFLLPYSGSAYDIERLLQEKAGTREVEKLFAFHGACGTFLGRLAKTYPKRVVQKRTRTDRSWIINSPDVNLSIKT